VRATTTAAGDLAAREQAVLELPGEGTRALAWALATADARDRDTAAAYAERGIAHLDIILLAIDDLLTEAAAADGADEDGTGGDGAGGDGATDEDDDAGQAPTEEDA
jgi:hypothetical protein